MKKYFDIIIVGAGIVGAATAWQMGLRYPNKKIAIIEKDSIPANHQSGRNSGVIHAGVYYQPGSLKAEFCRQGLEQTLYFCKQFDIPYQQCGKLIVATNQLEESRLTALYDNCTVNALSPDWIDKHQLTAMEPNIRGLSAVHVKHSGITDYIGITKTMLNLAKAAGAEVFYNHQVQQIDESQSKVMLQTLSSINHQFECDFMINCAGIYADELIRRQGLDCDFSILPFRGEYFRLAKRCDNLVNRLIYPVPDPELPFLGVHLTPMIGGYLTVGPNAVLALGKQAYGKFDVEPDALLSLLKYSGTWKLLAKHLRSGIAELRDSFYQAGYLTRIHKYCKLIQKQDLLPYRAGIRAQAVNQSGDLLHDFEFVKSARTLHVGNAPSPAATSAIPIAQNIVEQV